MNKIEQRCYNDHELGCCIKSGFAYEDYSQILRRNFLQNSRFSLKIWMSLRSKFKHSKVSFLVFLNTDKLVKKISAAPRSFNLLVCIILEIRGRTLTRVWIIMNFFMVFIFSSPIGRGTVLESLVETTSTLRRNPTIKTFGKKESWWVLRICKELHMRMVVLANSLFFRIWSLLLQTCSRPRFDATVVLEMCCAKERTTTSLYCRFLTTKSSNYSYLINNYSRIWYIRSWYRKWCFPLKMSI